MIDHFTAVWAGVAGWIACDRTGVKGREGERNGNNKGRLLQGHAQGQTVPSFELRARENRPGMHGLMREINELRL